MQSGTSGAAPGLQSGAGTVGVAAAAAVAAGSTGGHGPQTGVTAGGQQTGDGTGACGRGLFGHVHGVHVHRMIHTRSTSGVPSQEAQQERGQEWQQQAGLPALPRAALSLP